MAEQQKKWRWDENAEITISGVEFDRIYNHVKTRINKEIGGGVSDFEDHAFLFQANNFLDAIFKREIEKGTITEEVEQTPIKSIKQAIQSKKTK